MKDDIARQALPIQGDRLFHLRLAEASENAPLARIVGELFDERSKPLYAQLGAHFENEPTWRAAVAEHQAVIDAIAARDSQAARAAMHAHLQRSQDRFARPWSEAGES
jgi:DNA-binding FadR family transcriptional regulator